MDDRAETERTTPLSWREKFSKLLRIRSNRVSVPPDIEKASTTPSAGDSRRRNSTLEVPVQYVPQFDTHETRVNNEECPRMSGEPAFTIQPDRAGVPPSTSAVSKKSAISQMIPNAEKKFGSLFHVWDTRFSMKLFSSQNGIRKEEERRKNCKHWIIHPCSKFR